MTIDKLPSGSYRIRLTEDGRSFSLTVPYKPSEREAFKLIRAKIENGNSDISFDEAYKRYVDAKSNVLSPSTIRGYNSIYRNLPKWILKTDITKIDDYTIQKLVNEYSKEHSAKSTSNAYSLVLTVLKLFYPSTHICATLPQKQRNTAYMPSYDDVKRLLEHSIGTEYHTVLSLAALSLRCSEVCALTLDDLSDDNTITINKALVRSESRYVLKPTPKTDASYRTITLPDDLAEEIRKQGYIYRGYPNQINKYLHRALKELDIPYFSMHKLRHFFCSYAHEKGYSDAVVQSIGGWSPSSDIMRRIYRHGMNVEDAKKSLANDFNFF